MNPNGPTPPTGSPAAGFSSPQMAIVLASGNAERLLTFSTLVSGAAALGYEVMIFASYWGLDAFRAGKPEGHPPLEPGHGPEGERLREILRDRKVPSWKTILRSAKAIGNVGIFACSQSLEVLGLDRRDLDPLVDDVMGIASFVDRTRGAQATYFI
jgi:peroxiredoxin family protein